MNARHNLQTRIKPELVSSKTIKKLTKLIQQPVDKEPTWKENLAYFYSDYIRPNLFALIVMVLVAIFLSIKYLLKQEADEEEQRIKRKDRKHKQKERKLRTHISTDRRNMHPSDRYLEPSLNRYDEEDSRNRRLYADDEENRGDDEVSYYSLSKEYERELSDNDGSYSEMMLKDSLAQKRQRMTFDEMAKMIIGE